MNLYGFITGLEDGLFPLSRAYDNPAELEEERRLFYVALTRAKEKVYLSLARQRHRYGDFLGRPRSRFLDEIPDQLLQVEDSTLVDGRSKRKSQHTADSWKPEVGKWVEHPHFGRGQVLQVTGLGDHLRVMVLFEDNVVRKLMFKYAGLKPLLGG